MQKGKACLISLLTLVCALGQGVAAEDGSSLWQQAINLQQEQRLDEAIEKYNEAIKALPSDPSLWYSMGTAYQAKKDLPNARRAYQKAISLDPKNATYKKVLNDACAAEAAPFLQEAIRKQTTPDANGKIDIDGAIEAYKKAIELTDDKYVWYNLATAYYDKKDYAKMREASKKAGIPLPDVPEPLHYGDFLLPNGQPIKLFKDGG